MRSRKLLPSWMREAVYGLPELHADEIKDAALLANPGCYPTSIILALAPWMQAGYVDVAHGVICDSKSGISGAGKISVVQDPLRGSRRRLRGVQRVRSPAHGRNAGTTRARWRVVAVYAAPAADSARHSLDDLREVDEDDRRRKNWSSRCESFMPASRGCAFLARRKLPQIKFSRNTNYCDIGFSLSPDGTRAVLVSCIDNLLKGAAGQAVQNMNLMFGFDEKAGLQ